MGSERGTKTNRSKYTPKLEALEALRLLDAAALELVPAVADPAGVVPTSEISQTQNTSSTAKLNSPASGVAYSQSQGAKAGSATWDEALSQAGSDDWSGMVEVESPRALTATPPAVLASSMTVDTASVGAGLRQLDRYLSRAWARAGIPSSHQEDCTQAVHTAMLEELGRPAFDQMLASVGRDGVPQVLNRETTLGPDFFRAVDMIKKRAVRQRTHLAIDDQPEPAARTVGGDGAEAWRGVLNEAINRSLKPREADVIRATLQGFTPAEIAQQWGVAPKTVSNEKTRALAKLREALVAELED